MGELFRPEAHASRLDRLEGDLSLAPPPSWQGIGYLFLALIVTGAVFLATSSYSQVVTSAGVILPDKGLSVAIAARPGIVKRILVTEGQHVRRNQPIVLIESEDYLDDGSSVAYQNLSRSAEERSSLARQINRERAAQTAEVRQLEQQAQGLQSEIANVQRQIGMQRELIRVAEKDVTRTRTVAERGFVSQRDLNVREEALLGRQQSLLQLAQLLSAKQSSLGETRQRVRQASAHGGSQIEALSVSQAQLAQKVVNIRSSRNYLLRAPLDGVATSIIGKVGQPVVTSVPVLSIVPNGARLQAELAVPASAIGFVDPGQEMRLSVDAFPYQQFGTVSGRVLTIAAAPLPAASQSLPASPTFLVVASLSSPHVRAFGKARPLLPGMTVSARISTRRQTLFEWLFQPVFAMRNR